MAATLALEELRVDFRVAGETLPALGPLSLEIAAGSFVAIIGPSGGGKSTLLRTLAGLQRPTAGRATLNGREISQPSAQINILFQNANLLPWRDALANIALPLELAGSARLERRAAAANLLPALGLAGFGAAYPHQLSGGMAQRVALGRLLITRPAVMLLDEPFGALDALTRERLAHDLLRIWREHQPTVLLVTHDIQEATLLADRVLVLTERPGRLLADIPVPIARPRHAGLCYERDFLDCARRVRAAIEQSMGSDHAL